MKTTLWLTTFSLFLSAPLGFSKTELETLRSTVSEQERQIRQLEDENMKLRSLNGQPVKAPVERAPTASAPAPETASTGSSSYTVRSGDTLAKISRKTGASASSLAKLNGIKDPTRLSIGQKLKIPGQTESAPAKSTASAVAGSETYVIRDGDTFYSVAKKHRVSPESLIDANPSIKPSELRTGQLIRLSSKAAPGLIVSNPPVQKTSSETASVSKKPAAPVAKASAPVSTPTPAPAAEPTPKPSISPAAPASPAPAPVASAPKKAVHSVTIDGEMTYGEFATKHGTQIDRLNELNGLDLTQNTVLAKGSELYVSAQP